MLASLSMLGSRYAPAIETRKGTRIAFPSLVALVMLA
jgi:hypothetical protein